MDKKEMDEIGYLMGKDIDLSILWDLYGLNDGGFNEIENDIIINVVMKMLENGYSNKKIMEIMGWDDGWYDYIENIKVHIMDKK